MSVSMNDAVIQGLRESRLLDEEQWRHLLRDHPSPDPKGVLAWLKEHGLLTDWQISELLRGRRNFFLGKYRLLRLLGRGGMGEVYLAEHVTMHRRAAIKLISPRIGRNPEAVAQFLTEVRSIAALDHPNIVHAYNVDTVGDQYYLVIEYVEGESLQELVDQHGPLPVVEAADVIRQSAEGLKHVHEHGILHCDIKPANLLLNPQGVVKILDLGMARLIQGERAAATESREGVLGSVDYMAPELAMQSSSLDGRADIYSLGCTLFFALAGRPPFADGSVTERILKHQMVPAPSLASLRPDVPEELVRLCGWMLSKSPDQRPARADSVVEAIQQWEERHAQRLVRARPLEEVASEPQPNAPRAGGVPQASPLPGQDARLSHQPPLLATAEAQQEAVGADDARPAETPSPEAATTARGVGSWVWRSVARRLVLSLIAAAIALVVAVVAFLLLGHRRSDSLPRQGSQPGPGAPSQKSPDEEAEDTFQRGIEEFMRREKAKAASGSSTEPQSPPTTPQSGDAGASANGTATN